MTLAYFLFQGSIFANPSLSRHRQIRSVLCLHAYTDHGLPCQRGGHDRAMPPWMTARSVIQSALKRRNPVRDAGVGRNPRANHAQELEPDGIPRSVSPSANHTFERVQPAEPANPVQKQDFSGADLNGSKYAFAWRLFTPMVGLAAQYGSRCISRYGLAEVITLNLIALVPA